MFVTEISDKAWGHSKKAFYNTDYVDEDLEDSEEEEMLAQEEERESLALQRRMAESLQEHDFGLSYLPVSTGSVGICAEQVPSCMVISSSVVLEI